MTNYLGRQKTIVTNQLDYTEEKANFLLTFGLEQEDLEEISREANCTVKLEISNDFTCFGVDKCKTNSRFMKGMFRDMQLLSKAK